MIKFNDEQGAYTLEIGEIVFRWEKEPAEDYENQTYCEQTFDDIHIFSFEFLDDEFNEMQYFSIDG